MEADLRFPIGKFSAPPVIDAPARSLIMEQIAAAPAAVRAAVAGLGETQLDTPYRDGGWSVRQVVHHLPDSHINAYVRIKLGLTEEQPAIKTYEEALWAELPDGRSAPVEKSLLLLEALHDRWVACMTKIPADMFARTIRHPKLGVISLDTQLAIYAWHGRHHVAHITGLRERMGW